MVFFRRDRREPDRYIVWRVGLIFLAAGLWLGGVLADNRVATGTAIVVLLAALVLGVLGRRRDDGSPGSD